jgi:hypothetical protein
MTTWVKALAIGISLLCLSFAGKKNGQGDRPGPLCLTRCGTLFEGEGQRSHR